MMALMQCKFQVNYLFDFIRIPIIWRLFLTTILLKRIVNSAQWKVLILIIAILLSYLLAFFTGASMGFPLVFSFSIFSVIYYKFFYVFLYLLTKYSIYNRTIELIKKEEDFIDFFLKVCYIFASFCYFVYAYQYFAALPEAEVEESIKKDLVNPLQVVAQLSLFFFYFQYKRSDVRERQLTLLCFWLSVISTLYLLKVKHFFFSFMIFLFCFHLYKKNIDYVPLAVLLLYTLEDGLAKWGFFLLFKQLSFYVLSRSLDQKQSVLPPKGVIKKAIYMLMLQLCIGIIRDDFYLAEPAKLVVLLSGASIVFICLKKRSLVTSLIAFLIYFIPSVCIGLTSVSSGTLDLTGFSIFLIGHIIFLCGWLLFILPSERLGIVPFFFYTYLYILPYYPNLKWISKWIDGFDLLLLFLSLFSFMEE